MGLVFVWRRVLQHVPWIRIPVLIWLISSFTCLFPGYQGRRNASWGPSKYATKHGGPTHCNTADIAWPAKLHYIWWKPFPLTVSCTLLGGARFWNSFHFFHERTPSIGLRGLLWIQSTCLGTKCCLCVWLFLVFCGVALHISVCHGHRKTFLHRSCTGVSSRPAIVTDCSLWFHEDSQTYIVRLPSILFPSSHALLDCYYPWPANRFVRQRGSLTFV